MGWLEFMHYGSDYSQKSEAALPRYTTWGYIYIETGRDGVEYRHRVATVLL